MSINEVARPRGGAFLSAFAALSVAGAASTSALFTDSEPVTGNDFTAGWMDLTAGTQTSAISASDMAPGDAIARPLTLTNGGTVDLTWSASVGLADPSPLGGVLHAITFPVQDSAQCDDGTDLLPLLMADPTIRPVSPVEPNATAPRSLAAGEQTTVCLVVLMQRSVSSEHAGGEAELTWTFDATQATA
ncbi:TasA family protein [Cellulosimicrobium sp. Marseille-Q4280]|uniref:TasA family protein n=1 Tax=Cellulosimicrobium sp. Marseille-Q4280 TaxID=2937992 RepID=UPI00203FB05E|nr:TasA family protein [Cellulosimicrobium sp. Marseille-Q4280]